MENKTEEVNFVSEEINFRNVNDFLLFWKIRCKAFTPWYGHMQDDLPDCLRDKKGKWLPMLRFNAKAACFPEFYRQISTESGDVCGTLQMTPAYWGGEVNGLNNLEYYDEWHDLSKVDLIKVVFSYVLFHKLLKSKNIFNKFVMSVRAKKLKKCNTTILTAMFVNNEFRGQRIPTRLIEAAKQQTKQLGFKSLISPFRPSQYGEYKEKNNIKHSHKAFEEYSYSTNEEGFPVDAWLRALTKNGMSILRPEVRSFSVSKSIQCFELFKTLHKANDWYEDGVDIWECGETQTWYLNRNRNEAYSIEPNVWGQIPLD
jgi:hypothetical protein